MGKLTSYNPQMPDEYREQLAHAIMAGQVPSPMRLEFADLFCGIGGWTQGVLRDSDPRTPFFEQSFAIDSDQGAARYYLTNLHAAYSGMWRIKPSPPVMLHAHIQRLNPTEYPQLDVLFASPPPRSWFSDSPLHRLDEAQPLAHHILGFVFGTRPSFVFVEGPTNAVHDGRWQHMTYELQEAGYNIKESIVDAAQFGIPQSRRRMILIAARKPFVAPALRFEPPFNLRGWFDGLDNKVRHMQLSRLRDWQSSRLAITSRRRQLYENLVMEVEQRSLSIDGIWHDNVPLPEDGPALPIAVGGRAYGDSLPLRAGNLPFFSIGGECGWQPTLIVTPDSEVRRLGLRDALALQTFDERTILPKRAITAGRLIGEAMPPAMARAIVQATLQANNFDRTRYTPTEAALTIMKDGPQGVNPVGP